MASRAFSLGASCVLLCILHALIRYSVLASGPGFQSIVCGGQYDGVRTDSSGIDWVSDKSTNTAGISQPVTAPSNNTDPQFTSVRYFPGNHTKYCYLLDVTEENFYLVRASFWLGKLIYDSQTTALLDFQLLIDADEWTDITIPFPQSIPLVQEIFVRALSTQIAVCLAGKGIGKDIPFISTIELRPLQSDMHAVSTMAYTQCALHKQYRLNFGDSSISTVRYPLDTYDRIWDPQPSNPSLSTSAVVSGGGADAAPPVVLQTAKGGEGLTNFEIPLTIDEAPNYYFYELFFAEIDPKVNSSGQRVFDILVNGIFVWPNWDIYKSYGANSLGNIYRLNHSSLQASGFMNFTFQQNSSSIYGPLICGLEVLRLSQNQQSNGTDSTDATAVQTISSMLGLGSTWTGDPCLPYSYNWLTCDQAALPRITDLDLSNQSLSFQIPSAISNLTELVQISLKNNNLYGQIPDLSALQSLQILDLSNNMLSGFIPDFLSTLPSLNTLLLQNNNFSGVVPDGLLLRSNLRLNFSGNPYLCANANSTCIGARSYISKEHKNIGLVIGLVLGGLVLIGMVGICYGCFRKMHAKESSINPPSENVIQHNELVERSNMAHAFSYQDIEKATKGFSRKIGEGGFGPVYQGTLGNGVIVAIKVLSTSSHQGAQEFLNEVGLLSRVHHKNVVQLLGYCVEKQLMLVYEYMENGALSKFLYGSQDAKIGWKTRMDIALDVATGLHYLHQGCSPSIIHRDVKSSNILLNERMQAKLSDLGISKLKDIDTNSSQLASNVMGSPGYLDPEYVYSSNISTKSDVFSFGVVLLEIICGRPPIYQGPQSDQNHIVHWVTPMVQQGRIEDIIDDYIGNNYGASSLWKVLEVAMMCVQSQGKWRPSMTDVCKELKEAIELEHQNGVSDTITSKGEPASFSLTYVEPR